jgi:hypothetical protein
MLIMDVASTIKLVHDTSPVLLFMFVIAYFFKLFLEKRMEGIAGRFEEIAKTSLQIKSEIRQEERGELVAFRVAVEEWEDFLQTMVFDYTMGAPSAIDITSMYQTDKKLYLNVKLAVVRASIYLRDRQLEQQLMGAVMTLRKTYYPIINEPMFRLIDLQMRLKPINLKLAAFEKSTYTDPTFAPTEKDRDESAALHAQLTEEMQRFSENLLKEYHGIVEQLVALKESMNRYIYRASKSASIDAN